MSLSPSWWSIWKSLSRSSIATSRIKIWHFSCGSEIRFWKIDLHHDEFHPAPINSRLNVVVRSPALFGLGRNGCWPSRGFQLPRAFPFIFSLCCPLNDRRRAAHSFFKIGRLFSLFLFHFSCPSRALLRLLILLLLLMSGNVHPNPGPIFPCSVCAGNVTWRGKSLQCCACSKWVHLRCSQLSLSQFRALGSSHSWSCPPLPNHCDSLFGLLRHVYLHCAI